MTTLYRYKESPTESIARKIKEDRMGDKLKELYTKWAEVEGNEDDLGSFKTFQGGFTVSAQSMRARAMGLAQKANTKGQLNDLVNAIGSLSDIPTE